MKRTAGFWKAVLEALVKSGIAGADADD